MLGKIIVINKSSASTATHDWPGAPRAVVALGMPGAVPRTGPDASPAEMVPTGLAGLLRSHDFVELACRYVEHEAADRVLVRNKRVGLDTSNGLPDVLIEVRKGLADPPPALSRSRLGAVRPSPTFHNTYGELDTLVAVVPRLALCSGRLI